MNETLLAMLMYINLPIFLSLFAICGDSKEEKIICRSILIFNLILILISFTY